MLRRPADRLEGLAELAALAEALGDSRLELDVKLRRAAALRCSHDEDAAAELARRVATARRGRRRRGGRAARVPGARARPSCAVPIGESFSAVSSEVDIDGRRGGLRARRELAEELGDERSLAGALRELGR